MGQGNGSASREPTYHGLESDNLHAGEHLPAHWRAPGPYIILYIVINIMLPIEEKKLAYQKSSDRIIAYEIQSPQ